jgi:hypothetical protein
VLVEMSARKGNGRESSLKTLSYWGQEEMRRVILSRVFIFSLLGGLQPIINCCAQTKGAVPKQAIKDYCDYYNNHVLLQDSIQNKAKAIFSQADISYHDVSDSLIKDFSILELSRREFASSFYSKFYFLRPDSIIQNITNYRSANDFFRLHGTHLNSFDKAILFLLATKNIGEAYRIICDTNSDYNVQVLYKSSQIRPLLTKLGPVIYYDPNRIEKQTFHLKKGHLFLLIYDFGKSILYEYDFSFSKNGLFKGNPIKRELRLKNLVIVLPGG